MALGRFLALLLLVFPAALAWQDCTIDITTPNTDISGNYNKYPDPFEFYTNQNEPGITLLGSVVIDVVGLLVKTSYGINATNSVF